MPQVLEPSPPASASRTLTFRGVPLPALALLILGPLLVAMINLMIMFALTLQAVLAGIPPRTQAWIGTLYAAAYTVSAYLAGRWTKPSRAMTMLVTTTLGASAIATAAFLAPPSGLWLPLLLGTLVGINAGHYFVPLQARMGDVQVFHTVAWSVACYNASWGMGDALGPFVVGVLKGLSVGWLVLAAWAIGLFHLALVVAAARAPHPASSTHAMASAFASTRRQRLAASAAMLVIIAMYLGLVMTLYSGLGHARGWSERQIGLGLAVLAVPVPLTAPLFALLRHRMQQPWIMLASMVVSAASMAALPMTETWLGSLACLAGAGIGLACVAFHAFYYSNAAPTDRAHAIGVNESVVGLGSVAGPLVLGNLAWTDFTSVLPYRAAAGAIALVAAGIALEFAWSRSRKRE
ncbi:MAG: MFS transporter [Planctomycetota bacterium]|nr:MFS transporter [Planctomycetota bacterium]